MLSRGGRVGGGFMEGGEECEPRKRRDMCDINGGKK